MENLNVNQEMNFDEMADVVGGQEVGTPVRPTLGEAACEDLLEFWVDLTLNPNVPDNMAFDACVAYYENC